MSPCLLTKRNNRSACIHSHNTFSLLFFFCPSNLKNVNCISESFVYTVVIYPVVIAHYHRIGAVNDKKELSLLLLVMTFIKFGGS